MLCFQSFLRILVGAVGAFEGGLAFGNLEVIKYLVVLVLLDCFVSVEPMQTPPPQKKEKYSSLKLQKSNSAFK